MSYALTFQVDAGKRWPEAFEPGRLQLRIKDMTDDAVTLLAKEIEIQVALTADSAPALLAILENPESTQEARDFEQSWLKRIHPEHANAAGTRAWWTKNVSSAQLAETMAKINQDAE